jgi:catechol 2,3-dioxygenase-like lactoylglutathione lyase family enzyme
MDHYIRHIALVVPDLRGAEQYYQSLLQMELIGREAQLDDGQWYTLPYDKGWEEAQAAGIELGMLALRKGDIVLALFPGPAPSGQVFAIGLAMPQEQVAEIRKRVPPETEVVFDQSEQFNFIDRYGIMWQLVPPGDQFLMNGDTDDRWLEV